MGIAYSPTWLFQDLIDSGEVQVQLPGWQSSTLPLHRLGVRSRDGRLGRSAPIDAKATTTRSGTMLSENHGDIT
jgi:hypothetical protein